MRKIWQILGEDPNCDFGGSHIQPTLGYVEGEYEDVLVYAQTLKGWTQWGAGGKLVEINVIPIEKVYDNSINLLNQEIHRKEQELKKLMEEKEKHWKLLRENSVR